MADIPTIISLADARQQGAKFYYLGSPCPRGHVAPRYTSNRACSECTRGWSKAFYADPANKPKIQAKDKRWRTMYPERDRTRQKRWQEQNPEKYKASTQKWRAKNSERFKTKNREWLQRNPQKRSLYNNSRRARVRNAGGSHSVSDIHDLLRMQRGKCGCCRLKLGKQYHVDHIISLVKGGRNDRRNLQILCQPCNNRKSARDPIEFMRDQGFLI